MPRQFAGMTAAGKMAARTGLDPAHLPPTAAQVLAHSPLWCHDRAAGRRCLCSEVTHGYQMAFSLIGATLRSRPLIVVLPPKHDSLECALSPRAPPSRGRVVASTTSVWSCLGYDITLITRIYNNPSCRARHSARVAPRSHCEIMLKRGLGERRFYASQAATRYWRARPASSG